ncbi:MmyB family transcriptional regulator [Streptomyces violaceus]
MWATHDVRIRNGGTKRLQHPEVGRLELTYRSLHLPLSDRAVHDLTLYTAEPGTDDEDGSGSWRAGRPPSPARHGRAGTPAGGGLTTRRANRV